MNIYWSVALIIVQKSKVPCSTVLWYLTLLTTLAPCVGSCVAFWNPTVLFINGIEPYYSWKSSTLNITWRTERSLLDGENVFFELRSDQGLGHRHHTLGTCSRSWNFNSWVAVVPHRQQWVSLPAPAVLMFTDPGFGEEINLYGGYKFLYYPKHLFIECFCKTFIPLFMMFFNRQMATVIKTKAN